MAQNVGACGSTFCGAGKCDGQYPESIAVDAAGAPVCGASLTAAAGALVPGCHTATNVPSTTIAVAILMPVAHRLSGGLVLLELIIVS